MNGFKKCEGKRDEKSKKEEIIPRSRVVNNFQFDNKEEKKNATDSIVRRSEPFKLFSFMLHHL